MAPINPALQKLLQLKNKISFFQGLSDDEISDLIFNIRFQRFESKEELFHEGCIKTKEIYYLLSGNIDLYLHNKEKKEDAFLLTMNKPTLFGEMRSFIGEPRSATAVAGDGGAILITFLIKESKESSSPVAFAKFYKNVIKSLAKKIMDMNTRV